MDHIQIDGNLIAERYLRYALLPRERAAFEAHMVDCPECQDRLLLAQMFRLRKGALPAASRTPAVDPVAFPQPRPAWLGGWQTMAILLAITALAALAATAQSLWVAR